MSAEFSFPTEKVAQAGEDILSAAAEMDKLRQELLDATDKASAGWEGEAASTYLGTVRGFLANTNDAPKQMCANIGNRLMASLGNYLGTESRATTAMESVMKAFS